MHLFSCTWHLQLLNLGDHLRQEKKHGLLSPLPNLCLALIDLWRAALATQSGQQWSSQSWLNLKASLPVVHRQSQECRQGNLGGCVGGHSTGSLPGHLAHIALHRELFRPRHLGPGWLWRAMQWLLLLQG